MKTIKSFEITYNPHLIPSSSSSPDQLRGSTAVKDGRIRPAHPQSGEGQSNDKSKKRPKK